MLNPSMRTSSPDKETNFANSQKAFDAVPHQRLLTKLKAYGVHGSVHAWINSFLNQRKQRVVVNGAYSQWNDVRSGIPQGSVLGPTLFIIYINDLPETVESMVHSFADDTKNYRKIATENDCVELQKDLDILQEWSHKWFLSFNAKKCKVMRLGGQHPEFIYKMTNNTGVTDLEFIEMEKDLSIHVDKKLRLRDHADIAVAKANKILGLIPRSYEYLDVVSLKSLYTSLVRPHLEYGHTVWPLNYKTDLTLVENVQHRETRLVPALKDLEYTDRLKQLDLPSMAYRRCRGDMIEEYKYLHGQYNVDVSFLPRTKNSNQGHSLKLQKQSSQLKVQNDFFSLRVVDLWNSLPESMVSAPILNSFKNRLDKFWKEYKFNEEAPQIQSPYSTEDVTLDNEDQSTGQ